MTLPEPHRSALIAAASAGVKAIDRIVAEARRMHPERFVSAEEERLLLIARDALERRPARARDLHAILDALRRGL